MGSRGTRGVAAALAGRYLRPSKPHSTGTDGAPLAPRDGCDGQADPTRRPRCRNSFSQHAHLMVIRQDGAARLASHNACSTRVHVKRSIGTRLLVWRTTALALGRDVWEVVRALRESASGMMPRLTAAAELLYLSSVRIRAAIRYFSAFTQEIDARSPRPTQLRMRTRINLRGGPSSDSWGDRPPRGARVGRDLRSADRGPAARPRARHRRPGG